MVPGVPVVIAPPHLPPAMGLLHPPAGCVRLVRERVAGVMCPAPASHTVLARPIAGQSGARAMVSVLGTSAA